MRATESHPMSHQEQGCVSCVSLLKTKGGRAYLAPSLGLQSSMAGKAWHQEHEAAAQTACAVRKQRCALWICSLFPFNAAQDPAHGMMPPTFRVSLLSLPL